MSRAPRRHCCILQRSSRRTAAKGRKRYSDYDYDEDPADDGGAASGDDDGSTPRRFRNLRFTTEDRRFGALSQLQPLRYVMRMSCLMVTNCLPGVILGLHDSLHHMPNPVSLGGRCQVGTE